jgi:hypothetical protein
MIQRMTFFVFIHIGKYKVGWSLLFLMLLTSMPVFHNKGTEYIRDYQI